MNTNAVKFVFTSTHILSYVALDLEYFRRTAYSSVWQRLYLKRCRKKRYPLSHSVTVLTNRRLLDFV